MAARQAIVGVIGGSGVYQLEGLVSPRWKRVESPFGEPSDELLFGELNGQPLVFLPRHGRGHRISPGEINFRANIDALKRAGVTDIISVSAVGSFRDELPPGTFVVVDQFIDRTVGRESSFFGSGFVAHVSMAHPVCARVGDRIMEAARSTGIHAVRGGTCLVMQGPQFSSYAESRLHKSWGCDVVGMTAMPEAKLAREAELCYACVAMVTDFDCWHPDHDHVTVADIVRVLNRNSHNARALVGALMPLLHERPDACPAKCDRALDNAIMTAAEARSAVVADRLDAVAARILKPAPMLGRP